MTIEDFVCSKDAYANRETVQKLGQATYISLRPTCELDDYTVVSYITEAGDFRVDYGRAEGPPFTLVRCDDAKDAVETMIAIKAAHPNLRVWYDGLETQAEITGDVWLGLAEVLSEVYGEWELVAQVAAGTLAPDDPEVLGAIDEIPLIAAVIAHVTP
ncbi:hypothetical protein [Methylobacterium oryzisoli]|uniref:hypothetical protein n=1 Tax=Methylobacterium oryzisoli TaxID=3385502 RepID=UPI003892462A